jgi:hypothetical protein
MQIGEVLQELLGLSFRVLRVNKLEGIWSAQLTDGGTTDLVATVRYDALAEAQAWVEASGYRVMGSWISAIPDDDETGYRRLVIS